MHVAYFFNCEQQVAGSATEAWLFLLWRSLIPSMNHINDAIPPASVPPRMRPFPDNWMKKIGSGFKPVYLAIYRTYKLLIYQQSVQSENSDVDMRIWCGRRRGNNNYLFFCRITILLLTKNIVIRTNLILFAQISLKAFSPLTHTVNVPGRDGETTWLESYISRVSPRGWFRFTWVSTIK